MIIAAARPQFIQSLNLKALQSKNDARSPPGVCVIVLNWNGKEDTLACLESLAGVAHRPVHVVVVDNGSTDGSEAAIRATFPQVTLLQTAENVGYAGGNNVGFAHYLQQRAEEFVLVLNNDTIVDPSFIGELIDAAVMLPDGSVFGPKVYFQQPQNRIWSAGGRWDAATSAPVNCGEGEVDCQQFETIRECDFIVGCALLIPRESLNKLGGFDERFFLVHEESELCYRARRHGGKCYYVPKAKIWHKVSASFGGASPLANYFWSRNRLLFAEMHLSVWKRLRLFLTALLEVVAPPIIYGAIPGVPQWKRTYWVLRRDGIWSHRDYRDPYYRARLYGIRDYLFRRFGNCSNKLRRALAR